MRRAVLWCFGFFLLLVGGLVVFFIVAPPYLSWLETHEPLTHAPAIAVLNGDTYFRAEKAAALYFAGYAHEIWLTDDPESGREEDAGTRSNKRCLEDTHHIPREAVHVLAERIPERLYDRMLGKTFAEIGVIERELARRNMDRVIIVTSRLHGRGTRALWDLRFGTSRRAIVQHPENDGYVGRGEVRKEVARTVGVWALAPWLPFMNLANYDRDGNSSAAAMPPTTYVCK